MNELSGNLSSTFFFFFFTDEASLFSSVHDNYASRDEFNSDLKKISDWTLQ